MEIAVKTRSGTGREDMASYLEKLLRSELEPSESASSHAEQEQPAPLPPIGQQGGLPSWDRATAPGAADRIHGLGSEGFTTSPGIDQDHRPARPAPRKARSRAGSQGGTRSRGLQTGAAVLVPILAIVFVLVVRKAFAPASGGVAMTIPGPTVAAKPAADIEVPWERPPVYTADARDPMKMASSSARDVEGMMTQEEVRRKLDIRAIVHAGTGPAAILGGHLVYEGEAVPEMPGLAVTRIGNDGIEFTLNGRTWKQDAGQDLDIRGILVSEDRPAAILGTHLVHKGEGLTEIPGLTIIGIEPDGVELELGGQRWKQKIASRPEATPPGVERSGP